MFGISYALDSKPSTMKDEYPDKSLHDVKSVAGTAFHLPFVKSVCVFDEKGVSHLYLKKTDNGVVREEL